MKPFRWNIKKKEQLGQLLSGEIATFYRGYLKELRDCSANVLAYSDNRRMIFVGRSAENIFDYLSGILENTFYENRVEHLNISNRFYHIHELVKEAPDSYYALKEHFEALKISPKQLIKDKHGICFVDLVCEGFTFDRLFEFIERWCNEENIDKKSVWKKIKFIGITSRVKNSPNTYRWYQHTAWIDYKYKIQSQSISISYRMWNYMGNVQYKVTTTNKPNLWTSDKILLPARDSEQLKALRLAYTIYNRGLNERKELFVLSKSPKEKWLKDLLLSIRKMPYLKK